MAAPEGAVERLLQPWLEEHGDPGEYSVAGAQSTVYEGPAEIAYEDDEQALNAIWAIPHGNDALVLACILSEDARYSFADGFWHDPANWSDNEIPAPDDVVVIDRPAGEYTITVSEGEQSCATLTSEERIAVTGGTITWGVPVITAVVLYLLVLAIPFGII